MPLVALFWLGLGAITIILAYLGIVEGRGYLPPRNSADFRVLTGMSARCYGVTILIGYVALSLWAYSKLVWGNSRRSIIFRNILAAIGIVSSIVFFVILMANGGR